MTTPLGQLARQTKYQRSLWDLKIGAIVMEPVLNRALLINKSRTEEQRPQKQRIHLHICCDMDLLWSYYGWQRTPLTQIDWAGYSRLCVRHNRSSSSSRGLVSRRSYGSDEVLVDCGTITTNNFTFYSTNACVLCLSVFQAPNRRQCKQIDNYIYCVSEMERCAACGEL